MKTRILFSIFALLSAFPISAGVEMASYRHQAGIEEQTYIEDHPIDLLRRLVDEEAASKPSYLYSGPFQIFVLATSGPNGEVSSRVVHLAGISDRGIVFQTSANSGKAQQIIENPNVAATFFFPQTQRAFTILGSAQRLDPSEERALFYRSSRTDQIRHLLADSKQDYPITSRKQYEDEFLALEKKYHNQEIPFSPHFGVFQIIPKRISYVQERPYGQDRFIYTSDKDGNWTSVRTYP